VEAIGERSAVLGIAPRELVRRARVMPSTGACADETLCRGSSTRAGKALVSGAFSKWAVLGSKRSANQHFVASWDRTGTAPHCMYRSFSLKSAATRLSRGAGVESAHYSRGPGSIPARPIGNPGGAAIPHGCTHPNVRNVPFERAGAGPVLGPQIKALLSTVGRLEARTSDLRSVDSAYRPTRTQSHARLRMVVPNPSRCLFLDGCPVVRES